MVKSEPEKRVLGRLHFLEEMQEKPVYFIDEPPSSPRQRRPMAAREVWIENARPFASSLSLDREGFELRPRRSRVRDFYDAEEVRREYYAEVEALVREATGATRVHVFDHNTRNGHHEAGVRLPVRYAHNDYTLRSGPQRVRDLLGHEASGLLERRFAVVNVWRPIRGPVLDAPLAICDAQTLGLGDFVATDLRYPDRTGEVYSVRYNPNQRWYYFPRMETDETLLLKCFDSSEDGGARFSAHSAFDDLTAPDGAPPRESIEVRTLAFF